MGRVLDTVQNLGNRAVGMSFRATIGVPKGHKREIPVMLQLTAGSLDKYCPTACFPAALWAKTIALGISRRMRLEMT